MRRIIKKLLAAKGIHYLVTRFGPRKLRSIAFDQKYRSGAWNFVGTNDSDLADTVRRYLRNGDLLIMGCGGASVVRELEASGLQSVLGVDLSEEAIRLARRSAPVKATFQLADMVTFECPHSYDVILFSESLYYVPGGRQVALLNRLGAHLKSGGAFVVTLAEAKRYQDIIERVRTNFRIIEDHPFPGSTRHLLVFQPR